MTKLTLDDLDVHGKRVLVRVDFNVPLREHGSQDLVVSDDTRIRAALPTIKTILQRGGRAILMSHLGRPKGRPDTRFSLVPVASHLERMLGENVQFLPKIGDLAAGATENRVVLLENTRFSPGEKSNDPEFAARLARLGDVFVNDAFGTAHRAHASNAGITRHLTQAAAGYLLEREITILGHALAAPEAPFVAVLGGAKVSDKMGVITNLLDKVDALLIGGAMSYTFLKATGSPVGASLVETDRLGEANGMLRTSKGKLQLPEDHIVADAFDNNARTKTASSAIPEGWMGLDIGPATRAAYGRIIRGARTVVWNGPMGVFEMPAFAAGTQAMAEALVATTNAGGLTIVGGGDSVAAVKQGGYADAVTHVSTGGGAMLAFLEGRELPGLAALTEKE